MGLSRHISLSARFRRRFRSQQESTKLSMILVSSMIDKTNLKAYFVAFVVPKFVLSDGEILILKGN